MVRTAFFMNSSLWTENLTPSLRRAHSRAWTLQKNDGYAIPVRNGEAIALGRKKGVVRPERATPSGGTVQKNALARYQVFTRVTIELSISD
jgi:hypothetical protein